LGIDPQIDELDRRVLNNDTIDPVLRKLAIVFDLAKWGILIKVLPWTVLFCIVKVGIHWLGWERWAFDSLTGALFSAAIFTIALMLSGTLADYRSSEGMPSQIVNSLESIQDIDRILRSTYPDCYAQSLQQILSDVGTKILDWLQSDGEFDEINLTLDRINPHLSMILNLPNGALFVNRIQVEQANIRSISRQMRGNRDTDFLLPAYVLMWLFLAGSILALLLIEVKDFSESLVISAFMCTAFLYLLLLICDLDNPFEYDGKSSVDVDLSGLIDLRDRLKIDPADG
jgi:hypothetical protein